jgi:hypothetical protein
MKAAQPGPGPLAYWQMLAVAEAEKALPYYRDMEAMHRDDRISGAFSSERYACFADLAAAHLRLAHCYAREAQIDLLSLPTLPDDERNAHGEDCGCLSCEVGAE